MTPRPQRSFLAVLIIVIGMAIALWGSWVTRSNRSAAARYASSAACSDAIALTGTPSTECPAERIVITRKDISSGKGGTGYFFLVSTPTTNYERVRLGWDPMAHAFWRSHNLGDTIVAQRFAIPGYHLTNKVALVSDGTSTVSTIDNPVNTTPSSSVNLILGIVTMLAGIAVLRSRQ